MSLFYARITISNPFADQFVGVYSTKENAALALQDVLSMFHTTKDVADSTYHKLLSDDFDHDNGVRVHVEDDDFKAIVNISPCTVDETVIIG